MAKSGREHQSVMGLLDATEEQRPASRARRRVFLAIATLVALPTALFTLLSAVALMQAQANQQTYDKARFCATGTTDSQHCVLHTTAIVDSIHAKANKGKNAHGYTTTAHLTPDIGNAQTVTLDDTRNLTLNVNSGDRLAVLVWHNEITRFTVLGKTHDADQNPHNIVAEHLVAVSGYLAVACLTGRPVLRRTAAKRIALNPGRNRIPDWTLLWLVPATIVAALLRASWVVTGFGLAGIAILIGSALVWPRLPWVRQPAPDSLLGRRQSPVIERRR